MKKQKIATIGIYKIINPKGKIYIGQSTNIERRKNTYKNFQIKDQPKIYNSIKKYGWENHVFEIIEKCSILQLNERETHWKLSYLKQVKGVWDLVLFCNLYDTGGGPLSKETKQKISESNKGKKYSKESCNKISEKLKGRKFSKETLNKMSQPRSENAKNNMKYPKSITHSLNISKNNKGKPQPLEFINKLKKSNEKHYMLGSDRNRKISQSLSKPIYQYDKNMKFIKEWDNITEACIKLSNTKNDSGIGLVCNGKRKTAYGYIWRFKPLQ